MGRHHVPAGAARVSEPRPQQWVTTSCRADGKADPDAARGYVSTAVAMPVVVSLMVGPAFAVLYPLASGRWCSTATASASNAAGGALAVFVGITLVSLPLGVVPRIQLGYQESIKSSTREPVGSV
jgi:hypothetical protein